MEREPERCPQCGLRQLTQTSTRNRGMVLWVCRNQECGKDKKGPWEAWGREGKPTAAPLGLPKLSPPPVEPPPTPPKLLPVSGNQRAKCVPLWRPPAFVSGEQIVQAVCAELQVPPDELRAGGRAKLVVLAREVLVAVCRRNTDLSFPKIAKLLARRGHGALVESDNRVARMIQGATKVSQRLGVPESYIQNDCTIGDLVLRIEAALGCRPMPVPAVA